MRKYVFSGITDTGERVRGSLISAENNRHIGRTEIVTSDGLAYQVVPESVILLGDCEREEKVYWRKVWVFGECYMYRCPVCCSVFDTPTNYCPNCGKRLFDEKRSQSSVDIEIAGDD